TRAELLAQRGPGTTTYHLNPITGWVVRADGSVVYNEETWERRSACGWWRGASRPLSACCSPASRRRRPPPRAAVLRRGRTHHHVSVSGAPPRPNRLPPGRMTCGPMAQGCRRAAARRAPVPPSSRLAVRGVTARRAEK